LTAPAPIESLPPLRDVIREAGLSAKKSLGQNFLLDLNVTRRIARSAGPLAGVTVLEIGPGPGGLTRALLLEGASAVVALERDERFRPALAEIAAASEGRLQVLFADALEVDYEELAAKTDAQRIVANLPYNIATPLIVGWLTKGGWPPWYDKLVVMLQHEVAERLTASPGSESYGRLAVLAQFRARARLLFSLPPRVFTPSPRVSSALVEICPSEPVDPEVRISLIEKVTAAAFGQRRKMLRSSLASLGVDTHALLRDADIDPAARAEQLSVKEFARLARHLGERLGTERSPSSPS
jgi:16S rRNA (adenine1518-N6/adenine1519-N6)-dimethyltransferase